MRCLVGYRVIVWQDINYPAPPVSDPPPDIRPDIQYPAKNGWVSGKFDYPVQAYSIPIT